jgi:hypothetical protein
MKIICTKCDRRCTTTCEQVLSEDKETVAVTVDTIASEAAMLAEAMNEMV